MHRLLVLLAVSLIAACGHSQIAYSPSAIPGMTEQRAASIIEQGFYEDFSQQKPQGALVTPEYIALSNGSVTRGFHTGTAQAFSGIVVGIGSSYLRTEEINQRIYFRSVGTPILSKRNGRDNRYAVTIRLSEGVTARNVYFRSEQRAREFANALVYLSDASANGTLGAQAEAPSSSAPSPQEYKERQLQLLEQETGLGYEEYMKRRNAIQAQ